MEGCLTILVLRVCGLSSLQDAFQNLDRVCKQGSYSPTILKNVLCLILQIFLYLAAFACNTTSDWLNHMVNPIRSCVTFKFTNLGENDKECSREWLVNTGPGVIQ